MAILKVSPNHLVVEVVHWWLDGPPDWNPSMQHDQNNRAILF